MRRDGVFAVLIMLFSVAALTMSVVYSSQKVDASTSAPSNVGDKGVIYEIGNSSDVSTISSEINAARINAGRVPLKEHSLLSRAASMRIDDMVERRYYAHISPNGLSFADQIRTIGITATGFACENLLMTHNSNPKDIVEEWLDSEAHRQCLLSDSLRYLGVSSAIFDASVRSQDQPSAPLYVVAVLHSEVIR